MPSSRTIRQGDLSFFAVLSSRLRCCRTIGFFFCGALRHHLAHRPLIAENSPRLGFPRLLPVRGPPQEEAEIELCVGCFGMLYWQSLGKCIFLVGCLELFLFLSALAWAFRGDSFWFEAPPQVFSLFPLRGAAAKLSFLGLGRKEPRLGCIQ